MAGRRLCSGEDAIERGFGGADSARRREVLRETIAAFDQSDSKHPRRARHADRRIRRPDRRARGRSPMDPRDEQRPSFLEGAGANREELDVTSGWSGRCSRRHRAGR